MTTKPALKKTKTDEVVQNARMMFIAGLLDVSWRLATVFLVPVMIGVVVDQIQNTSKFTVYGTFIGIVLAVIFIYKQSLEANKK